MNDKDWQDKLTDKQYKILRQKGTEPAFSGKYVSNHDDGSYYCAGCGNLLFASDTKFDSGSGWPSFTEHANLEHIKLHEDTSHDMQRTEVTCANCDGHLGHVFPDGPAERGGQRFCINSLSLDFKPKDNDK